MQSRILSTSWTSGVFKILLATLLLITPLVSAHFSMVYPGWRGNTLFDDMQWKYPCGGLTSKGNRTRWPMNGGKIQIIPGWNAGHPTSFFYVNMGYGTVPVNHSHPMVPIFQITAPSRDPFPGQFCLRGVPLPVNATENGLKPGDNATIQVIQVALHGASLYNCADVILVEDESLADESTDPCINSTTIGFNQVYSTKSRSAGSWRTAGDGNARWSGM
ncbi:hypothetical protein BDZ91DRAFT_769693 [Kalaharituber pfeilii]|nr:hypothetical protein BDZ91DRAFT_769693 [Kalaharituber pfeilii]